jgi:8-oxo-dGTP diphosphatase
LVDWRVRRVENRRMIERRLVVVFVVARQGRVLMQHRSPTAGVGANQWSMPGGKIEDGERPVDAARREVAEETGLTLGDLTALGTRTRPSVTNGDQVVELHLFAAATDAGQQDVVVGEGQAMVFLAPSEALARDLGVSARLVLAPFLVSPEYARLRDRGTGTGR